MTTANPFKNRLPHRHREAQAFLSIGSELSASAAFSTHITGLIVALPDLFRQEVSAARQGSVVYPS